MMATSFHNSFHNSVFAVKPKDPIKPSTFWVGVLSSHLRPSNDHKDEDFLWIKCHGAVTVKKVHEQYMSKHPGEGKIFLKHANILPPYTSTMHDLNVFGDRTIAFEAIKAENVSARMAADRPPLQPSKHQVSVKPDPDAISSKVKNEDVIRRVSASRLPVQDENSQPGSGWRSPFVPPYQSLPTVPPPSSSYPKAPGAPQAIAWTAPMVPNASKAPIFPNLKPAPAAPNPPNTSDASNFPNWATSNGFLCYCDEWRETFKHRNPQLNDGQIQNILHRNWMQSSPMERERYENVAKRSTRYTDVKFKPIKTEVGLKDVLPVGNASDLTAELEDHRQQTFQLQILLKNATPELLESSVEKGVSLLDQLKGPLLEKAADATDAVQWVNQIENLRKQAVRKKTIIGVVGNTGAGKSSVINALLDEERIIPTNCMRACTAVVTEISYSDDEIPYHAQIEFIKAVDWERELKTLFQDLIDPSGAISKDCSSPDTDAGIAYAKIKAVYPKKTKDDIANSSIEKMLKEVSHILGTNREIKETDSLKFYQRLQHFVDSKEKTTGDKDKDKKKERKEMEFWPLIRVVRIHIKSPALSTGAVIVDLPGVHDSNAARAAVAENYMKQCTGLWIVAPINRAVDDKAAKNLLGESFKRQLKMDGGFSTVTLVCSKTDDISLMEAQESLGLDDEMGESWIKMEELSKIQKAFEREKKALRETKELLGEVFNDSDEQIEVWDALKDAIEEGKAVYAPPQKVAAKKRKANNSQKSRKRQRRDDSDDGFIDDDSEGNASEPDAEEAEAEEVGNPLNEDEIDEKLNELRSAKKEAKKQRLEIAEKIKDIDKKLSDARVEEDKLAAEMSALCISGRNQYSKGAIQTDFAQGIRELDQELAAEEDEENFDPDNDSRDYDEVARSLPVFCVSSRAYQKLQGRLRKDPTVPGFKAIEETEIPQLQAHCKLLTEAGRTANCKRFINNLSQLLNSLSLWASNDGSGANMTPEQRRREAKYLQKGLKELETGLDKVVRETSKEIAEEFHDNIFERYDLAIANATEEAAITAQHWGLKVNREDRAAGGYHWSTYKAICRRNGEYSNAQGPHQWNYQLVEPMIKMLASGWEKTFSRRLPMVLSTFVRNAANLLREFHRDVDGRARKVGAGIAGLHVLQQQLGVYETLLKDLTATVKEIINNTQKEINREFTPVITRAMVAAYEACVNESGMGSYARMKAAMNAHVDQERHVMFQESADEVQHRLEALVQSVEETMGQRTDEVFIAMRGDYRSVLGGSETADGEILPKAQRMMRKEVMGIIEGVEKMFKKVVDPVDDDDKQSLSAKEGLSDGEVGNLSDNRQNPKPEDASDIEHNSDNPWDPPVNDYSETESVPDNEQIPQPKDSDLGEKSEHLPSVSIQEVFGLTEPSETRPNVETSGVAMEEPKAELANPRVESSVSEDISSRDRPQQCPSRSYGDSVRGHPSHLYDSSANDKEYFSSSDNLPLASDSSEYGNDSDDD